MLRDDFRLMPVDTTVAVGDTAVLKCNPPKGNPRPVVRWLKNNVYIDEFSYPSAIAAASLTSDDEEEQSRRLDESGRLLVSFSPLLKSFVTPNYFYLTS